MEKRDIIHKLGYMNLLHRYNMQQTGARIGLFYGQQAIIGLLCQKGAMSQKQIAEALHMSAPNITAAVKRMLRAGIIRKKTDKNDMRVNLIEATELGEKLSNEFKTELDSYDEKMFRDFSEEDCKQLDFFLNKIIANLDGDADDEQAFFRLIANFKDKKKFDKDKDGMK